MEKSLVFLKYIIKRPYDTNHIFQFDSIQGQPNKDNVNQLQMRSLSEEICSGVALQSGPRVGCWPDAELLASKT